MRVAVASALLLVAGLPASAHRLDEYLQGALISVEKDRVQVQITLTPGVAIFPFLIASIDTDKDGVISEREQRAYAERVLQDVSLGIDGHRLTPQLSATRFPTMAEMKEGSGEIQLDLSAMLPSGARDRQLTFQNRHQSGISAYQVNCLIPRDPGIKVVKQNRNYLQSVYQLDYEQTGVPEATPFFVSWSVFWSSPVVWLGVFMILVFTRFLVVKLGPRAISGGC
jgi:hypothetical protein